jgi:hypothetical protein
MRQEESLDGAVKYDDLNLLIILQRADDLVELPNRFRTKDVEGRVIKRDTPVRWGLFSQKNLFRNRVSVMCFLLSSNRHRTRRPEPNGGGLR